MGPRCRRNRTASARKRAVINRLNHSPGLAKKWLGAGLLNASMDMRAAVGAGSGPPPNEFANHSAKYDVLNAIFSKIPIPIGGNVAHKIGNRRAHADTSSNHP